MNDQSESERSSTVSHWFGLDRLRINDGDQAIDITIGPGSHWDRSHLRRLRQSGDLPGMVPIIDSDFSADGKPFAVTPAVEAQTLASLLGGSDLTWANGAGIAEAVARAIHEAHLRGLFHGAISPDDVHVIGTDVALGGVGLSLGGTLPPDREQWAAPEVRDGADPTERSDVYSLGKLLEAALGDAIDAAPRSIRRLIMWSSSDTPEARPPSAMEFASILAEGLGEERRTYGPAFVSTSELSELATRASSAVSSHSPSETARATESSTGTAAAAAAAGVALGATGSLSADQASETIEAPVTDGFSVSEAADIDPGVTIDSLEGLPVAETAPAAEDPTEELVSASLASPPPRAEAVNEYTVPAAAQTVDLDETYLPRKQRSRAGLMLGAILLLGLAAILWGLLTSDDDTEVANSTPATTEATPATTEATAPTTATTVATTEAIPATTEATPPTTATTVATTVATTGTTVVPTSATTNTTQTPATSGSAAPLVPNASPIAAGQAAIQILHGVPGAVVDLYVNGDALITGFEPGGIAGPIDLPAGDYAVALFAAQANPPAAAADRSDDALFIQEVAVGTDPYTLVAHLAEGGALALTGFEEQLSPVDPGQSRIMLRHLMATGPLDASVNGTIIGSLSPGEQAAIEVGAGPATIEFLAADGTVVATATVTVEDGQLASLSAIGSPDDRTAQIVIQRYSGLATAPTAVPTGDSGLLGLDDDQLGLRLVYALMAVLALSGGLVAFRRQRSWS